jgi:predicted DNA-binding protein (MmcQ/YjbR family)
MKLTSQQVTRQQAALNALRAISRKLPGAEEYVMVHHPAFRVGKKPYAIAGMDEGKLGATVSINLGPEAQGHLLADDRFSKTPYIGQHGWVTVPFKALSEAELSALVVDSYRRIAGKKLLAQLQAPKAAIARATSEQPAKTAKTKQKVPAKASVKAKQRSERARQRG